MVPKLISRLRCKLANTLATSRSNRRIRVPPRNEPTSSQWSAGVLVWGLLRRCSARTKKRLKSVTPISRPINMWWRRTEVHRRPILHGQHL